MTLKKMMVIVMMMDDDDDDDYCDLDDKEDRVMGSCDPESVRRCLRQPRLPDSLKSCGETNFTGRAYFHPLFPCICLLYFCLYLCQTCLSICLKT